MKIDICSPDMGFLHVCRAVLESWSKFICVNTELAVFESWEGLPARSPEDHGLLILDADPLETTRDLKELETVREAYGALLVCSRDSRKAIALYRLRPTAFLGKPLSAALLDKAMSRCVSLWQTDLQNLELTENRSRLKMPMCDILWAEAQGRSCMLHCLCRDVQVGESMNELMAKLPGEVFIRCQRSYLVNLHHVKAIDGKCVYMTNGDVVSMGRNTRLEVMSAVQAYQEHWNMLTEQKKGST